MERTYGRQRRQLLKLPHRRLKNWPASHPATTWSSAKPQERKRSSRSMQPSENPGELLNPETRSLNEVLTNLSGLLTQRITTFHTGDRLCRGSLRPSNGLLTRLRVHALRPAPVDAGNKAQIPASRILATILVDRLRESGRGDERLSLILN